MGSQRAFVADASHQLRTPLTALRLRIESLEDALDDGRADPELARSDLEAIDAELERLGELVEGLLALARSETGATATGPVDAAAVADAAVARWLPLADEHRVALQLDAPERAVARAAPGSLDQILDNLLDNALGVAPVDSAIEVAVFAEDREVEVSVRDHGPGLSAQDRGRATDRFWRAPDADPGGSGLGLAIVDQLARGSGGSVRLDAPVEGTGLVVTVRLPRERAVIS